MAKILGKYWNSFLVIAGLVVAFWVTYALRSILLPFILGIVFLYILSPVISWLETKLPQRGQWKRNGRVYAILISYVVILGLVGLLALIIANTLSASASALAQNTPQLYSNVMRTLQDWTNSLRILVPAELRSQVDTLAHDAGTAFYNAIHDIAIRGVVQLPLVAGSIISLIVTPVFLFYIIRDKEKLISILNSCPEWFCRHIRNIGAILEWVLGRYIRAQLLLGLVVGTATMVGLLIIGAPFAFLLAIIAGVAEMVPMIGPVVSTIFALFVTLALAPGKVILVGILFIGVQILENIFVVPRIQGSQLRIHPAVALIVLIVGAYIAGIWGLILAVPLTATTVKLSQYAYRFISEENQTETSKFLTNESDKNASELITSGTRKTE